MTIPTMANVNSWGHSLSSFKWLSPPLLYLPSLSNVNANILVDLFKFGMRPIGHQLKCRAFDVSKQMIGALELHFTNILLSDIASRLGADSLKLHPNPCVWYNTKLREEYANCR